VGLVARGAKRPRSELRGLLQAFQPLTLAWAGAASSRRSRRPNGAAGCRCPGGAALLCGFYLNELLLKLLPREDPHPALLRAYEDALRALDRALDGRRARVVPAPLRAHACWPEARLRASR
jgi:DNA repair protein RecO (recombination protein O)